MFPLPFNFPFRKNDGSLTTIGDAISSGGGSYTLPTASANTKGGVKIGSGLTMNGETLNADGYTLPIAGAETLGGVKVGSGLSIDENGVMSASGGGGGGSTITELWSGTPTSAGNTQYELSSDNYDALIFICRVDAYDEREISETVLKGKNVELSLTVCTANYTSEKTIVSHCRYIEMVSATKFKFVSGSAYSTTTTWTKNSSGVDISVAENNNKILPVRVLGIKY